MNSSFTPRHRFFRLSVWTTLLMQTFTPLALSLTPILVAKAEDPRMLIANPDAMELSGVETRPYVLKSGETVALVAKQYGLTITQLKRLNQFRVFAHGFNHLKVGDELDVPVKPVTGPGMDKQNRAEHSPDMPAGDNDTQQMAGYASQAGGILASRPDGQAAAGMVKGMAVGKANQTVQEWMSQFGTAQVQLGVDEDFSLKHSSLNLLHPWYDTPDNMVFSQTGIHRTDERTQANLGAGYRHFRSDDMLGLNAFLDYDLSRDHARAGFGGEYWRNFLKLSANAYVHISGWKESPDVEDYDERPANGWDVRVEGYLPSYPQLGAKVMYEQYYGDEVALFGKDERQKNPHAITAGVSYTPVPLLTLSADEKTGQDGQHDTEIKADLNYRIGEPLSHQLDTDAVAASRSLVGSRYDLIDRNNDIILEYRKQEVIKLHVPARITGAPGQVIPLTLDVNAKHGLKDIIWDDAALLAAGGKLNGAGTQWVLTLPAWQAGAVNAWSVMAVAHDTKDNASKPSEMQVVLAAPAVHAAVLAAQPERLLADGKSASTITLTLKDDQGNAVTGQAGQLTLSGTLTPDAALVHGGTKVVSLTPNNDPVLTHLKETTPGEYTATLTAGTVAGKYALTAALDGTTVAQTTAVIEDTAADITQSTLTKDLATIAADGTATSTLTLSLNMKAPDGSLQPVSGEASRLTFFVADGSVDASKYSFTTPQEGKAGQYTSDFSGILAATQLPLGVKINGKDSGLRVQIDLTASTTVVVSGNPVVGETLTATPTCTTACGALTYQWQIETASGSNNWTDITGATNATYQPVKEDQKKKIRVKVTE